MVVGWVERASQEGNGSPWWRHTVQGRGTGIVWPSEMRSDRKVFMFMSYVCARILFLGIFFSFYFYPRRFSYCNMHYFEDSFVYCFDRSMEVTGQRGGKNETLTRWLRTVQLFSKFLV